MADRFEDHRGVIQDLLVTPLDAVTEIRTLKGKIRGNHYHKRTTQWTYIVSGLLLIRTAPWQAEVGSSLVADDIYEPGQMACEEPGISHAWEALEDTTVLVFTRGPRSGDAYESDVYRLEVPLL
jgi:quercetin dioxygenase-like cupin family protein